MIKITRVRDVSSGPRRPSPQHLAIRWRSVRRSFQAFYVSPLAV